MPRFGLSDSHLQALQQTITRFGEVEQALIYGSRAMGTHKRFSDIDIALVGRDISEKMLYELDEAIDDLLLPYEVDLTPVQGISNSALIAHIERVGQVLVEQKKCLPTEG